MPQYQGVWNLQDAARLQSIGQWVKDPQFNQTTLLLQGDSTNTSSQNNYFLDSSSNAFVITRNGNTTQGSFTPFSQAPGYWGNYFGGSDAFRATASALSNAQFTVEAWVYFTGTAANQAAWDINGGGNGYGHYVALTSAGVLQATFYSNNTGTLIGAINISGGVNLVSNTWAHVAVSYDGATYRFFVNGVLQNTLSSATTITATSEIDIGQRAGTQATGYQWVGYISNFRYVTGAALYTANFTPTTSPLSAAATGTTRVLYCQSNRFVDNSASPYTFTISGTPSVQAFSPFAPQYQWTSSVIGGSGYFNGSTDYLSIASPSTSVQFGTGNFTVECWIYPTSTGTSQFVWQVYGTTIDNLNVYINGTTGVITSDVRATNQSALSPTTASGAFVLNTWNHIAMIRDSSTTIKLYVNGVQAFNQPIASTTAFNDVQFSGNPTVGAKTNPVANYYTGYVSNWRVVKGQALATGAFTPPSAPVTSTSVGWTGANAAASLTGTVTILYNFTNAGIYDATMENDLQTVADAKISTAVVKYGSGSMYFDGTGDWLYTPTIPIAATGPFTIEAWIYLQNTTDGAIWTQFTNATANRSSLRVTSGKLVFYNINASNVTSTASILTNVWTHIAVTRDESNTLRIFINGVLDTTSTGYTYSIQQIGATFGAFYDNSSLVTGYMDDIRISKFARYTASFTPPQVALPRQ